MNTIMSKLRVILRSELLLIKAEANRRSNRLVLTVIAVAAFCISILFFNIGFYFSLTELNHYAHAAYWVGLINLICAIVPFVIARTLSAGKEELMIREIRDMSLDGLSDDLDKNLKDIKALKNLFSILPITGGRFNMKALLPLFSGLLALLSSKKSAKETNNAVHPEN